MERDIIVIVEGGGMTVGFGIGVLEALQKKHIYGRIHSVYGSSAGAHDAAYFLSRQTDLGGEVPIEYLSRNQFIKKGEIVKFVKSIIWGKKYNLMDINYLINVERHVNKLNVHTILNSPTNLYFRVFNINKLKSEIIDGKDHVFEGLAASSSCIPYFNNLVKIRDNFCIDGSDMVTEPFENIILKNKDKKIIYIVNHKESLSRAIINYPIRLFEAFLIWRLYGLRLAYKYATRLDIINLDKLDKYENTTLIVNDFTDDFTCTDKEKLTQLYNYGKEQGKKIIL